MKSIKSILVVTAVLVAVVTAYWYISSYKPKSKATEYIANSLLDPESARFRNVRFEGLFVCGEVNGKNHNGGYVGFRPFVYMGTQGEANALAFIEIENPDTNAARAGNEFITNVCKKPVAPVVLEKPRVEKNTLNSAESNTGSGKNAPDLVVSSSSSVIEPAGSATTTKLSELSLNSILIQQGDLAAGFSGDQISFFAPRMFEKLPVADNIISQRITEKGEISGGVTVFLYEDKKKATSAYNKIVHDMLGIRPVKGIGEKASMSVNFFHITFVRLNAVVYISGGASTEADIQAYAARLDSRLEKLLRKK